MTEPSNALALDILLGDAEFLRGVLDQVSDGVMMVDRRGDVIDWNHGAEVHAGYLRQEVLGRNGDELLAHCTDAGNPLPVADCPLNISMADRRPHQESLFVLHKQGYRFPASVSTNPIRVRGQERVGAMEIFRTAHLSASARRWARNTEEVRHHDADTGLPGPELTRKRLREAILRARLEQKPLGVVVVDFNNLRAINARFGYEAGNQALRVTAQTLTHCSRYDDFVGRWKEDSFLVVAFLSAHAELAALAARLDAMVSQSVLRWWGESRPLKATFGLTIFDGHERLEDLTHRAEEIAAQLWAGGQPS